MTAIWMYFTINDGNQSKADCSSCSVKISSVGLQYTPIDSALSTALGEAKITALSQNVVFDNNSSIQLLLVLDSEGF